MTRPRGWRRPRRRRGRSHASARRPRKPLAARPFRATSGRSRPPRNRGCRAACRGRRRCGSAAPPPSRPSTPTTPARSAPARSCWPHTGCAAAAAASSSTSRHCSSSPPSGQRCSNIPASRSARRRGSGSTVSVLAGTRIGPARTPPSTTPAPGGAPRRRTSAPAAPWWRNRCGRRRRARRRRPRRRRPSRPDGTPGPHRPAAAPAPRRRGRRRDDIPCGSNGFGPCAAGSSTSTPTTS